MSADGIFWIIIGALVVYGIKISNVKAVTITLWAVLAVVAINFCLPIIGKNIGLAKTAFKYLSGLEFGTAMFLTVADGFLVWKVKNKLVRFVLVALLVYLIPASIGGAIKVVNGGAKAFYDEMPSLTLLVPSSMPGWIKEVWQYVGHSWSSIPPGGKLAALLVFGGVVWAMLSPNTFWKGFGSATAFTITVAAIVIIGCLLYIAATHHSAPGAGKGRGRVIPVQPTTQSSQAEPSQDRVIPPPALGALKSPTPRQEFKERQVPVMRQTKDGRSFVWVPPGQKKPPLPHGYHYRGE
jgi:hypothetical protein